MNKRRLSAIFLLAPIALFLSFTVPQLAQNLGRDFLPLLQTIAIIQDFEGLRLQYILGGNLVLLYLVGILFNDAHTATYFLFSLATALRFLFCFIIFGPLIGLGVYLSFFVNHDLNQSRLSIGVVYAGSLIIILGRISFFQIVPAFLFHYISGFLVVLYYLYQREKLFGFTRLFRFLIFLFLTATSISIVEFLLPRYFVDKQVVIPKNFLLYYAASIGIVFLLSDENKKISKYILLSLFSTSVVLILNGVAGIYLGRFAELGFLATILLYGREIFSRSYYIIIRKDIAVLLLCLIVSCYQFIILSGNIWRFI